MTTPTLTETAKHKGIMRYLQDPRAETSRIQDLQKHLAEHCMHEQRRFFDNGIHPKLHVDQVYRCCVAQITNECGFRNDRMSSWKWGRCVLSSALQHTPFILAKRTFDFEKHSLILCCTTQSFQWQHIPSSVSMGWIIFAKSRKLSRRRGGNFNLAKVLFEPPVRAAKHHAFFELRKLSSTSFWFPFWIQLRTYIRRWTRQMSDWLSKRNLLRCVRTINFKLSNIFLHYSGFPQKNAKSQMICQIARLRLSKLKMVFNNCLDGNSKSIRALFCIYIH